jgi:Icc-related predicted phosphoesterase
MTRRLCLEWPDPTPFRDRGRDPIRILAVSDLLEPTLLDRRNRQALGSIDLIVGCEPEDIAFVADGFDAPILYVLGNHDGDSQWAKCAIYCPDPMTSESVVRRAGIAIAGLTWPGSRGKGAHRSESMAWRQVLRLASKRLGREDPLIVISHVPPLGSGDVPTDAYHRGFHGYDWLLHHLRPRLWLHGHTPLAATGDWFVRRGDTYVINVTGAVLIELLAPGSKPASNDPASCSDENPAEAGAEPTTTEEPTTTAEPVAPAAAAVASATRRRIKVNPNLGGRVKFGGRVKLR